MPKEQILTKDEILENNNNLIIGERTISKVAALEAMSIWGKQYGEWIAMNGIEYKNGKYQRWIPFPVPGNPNAKALIYQTEEEIYRSYSLYIEQSKTKQP